VTSFMYAESGIFFYAILRPFKGSGECRCLGSHLSLLPQTIIERFHKVIYTTNYHLSTFLLWNPSYDWFEWHLYVTATDFGFRFLYMTGLMSDISHGFSTGPVPVFCIPPGVLWNPPNICTDVLKSRYFYRLFFFVSVGYGVWFLRYERLRSSLSHSFRAMVRLD